MQKQWDLGTCRPSESMKMIECLFSKSTPVRVLANFRFQWVASVEEVAVDLKY
jgi:hypothetical protein